MSCRGMLIHNSIDRRAIRDTLSGRSSLRISIGRIVKLQAARERRRSGLRISKQTAEIQAMERIPIGQACALLSCERVD